MAVWRELLRTFHPGQRVLEINCGTGIDAVSLGERGIRVLACDIAPRMIELAALPFSTSVSPTFGFPVPEFALRVREMQIESAHRVRSHTLFVARTIGDQCRSSGQEMFVVHRIYQAARQRAHMQIAGIN